MVKLINLLLGDVKMIRVIKVNQDKFYNEFMDKNIFYKNIHIKSYRELLSIILDEDDKFTIEELEEMLVTYIKIIGILESIEIKVFENSNLIFKNKKHIKYIYLDNLESIIKIINSLCIVDKIYIEDKN